MEQLIGFFALVILGVPLVAGIWLILRAVSTRQQIEELNRRVDDLHQELARLKQSTPVAPKPMEGKIAAFMPATLPSRKVEAEKEFTPPPPVPIIPPLPAAAPPFVPKLVAPVLETAKVSATPTPDSLLSPEKTSLEMRLGTYWLVRIGIVILVTGLAFGANLVYHNVIPKLGPPEKISLLYLASALLLGAGAWWQRRNVKESLKNYAQVLFAGGLAAVYFTTYAAHYAPPVRVIQSALLDGTLLFLWAAVIAWIADRRKSEVMAMFAVGLAFFTSVITRVGEFTLYSNLILTIAAVVFLVRNRWAGLSFASLITSYTGYAFWRFLRDDGWHWATPDENLQLGACFLAGYWLVFTAATFLSRSEKLSGSNRAAFLTLNNGAFFALFLLTMLQVHTGGFWKFSLGYGTVLLTLAALAKKFLPAEPLARNSYLTHGLLLVTLGLISKFAGLQLALVLGTESVVLFVLGAQRQSHVLKFFAYAAALLATGWCGANLESFDPHGIWTGTCLGAMLAFNAFWAHRGELENTGRLRAEPTAFAALALASWLATTWFNTTEAHLPPALAAEAVALTLSIYLLRVPEITVLGQSFLVFAQAAWLVRFLNATPPWWNPLVIIAATIGLSHWWQRQKALVVSRNFFVGCTALSALVALAVTLVWLHPLVSAPEWLVLTSLLAVVVTGYGLVTRAWPLAICGQIFLGVSVWEFSQQLLQGKPDWYFPLAPLIVLTGLSFATVGWFARQSGDQPPARTPLLQVAMIYRWLALAMSLPWIWDYVPERQRVWACMLAGMALFALAVWRGSREALAAAAIYAGTSLALIWMREDLMMDIYVPNLLALLALFAMQQVLRRAPAKLPLNESIHGALVMIAGVSLWRFLSCWIAQASPGFSVTMLWAGFAVVVFAGGILLRERFLRWFGLGVLAAAVGRIILVDVWNQESGYRVLTFLALGVALLVIGFIYNKYQEKIRQWL